MSSQTDKKAFTAQLAPKKARITGGFASSGSVNPCRWADEIYKETMPGPWLCCYMLRRFGWPNAGSDDHKEICSWTVTTPMPGLYLSVAPYLGSSNLHFGVRFSREVESRINQRPGRTAYFVRRERALVRWWQKKGIGLYAWGVGTEREGEEDTLVHTYSTTAEGEVCGLWLRTPAHGAKFDLPKGWRKDGLFVLWLDDFVKKKHPEVRLPKPRKRERARKITRFDIKVRSAIRATLRDLLRSTNVRDLEFTPFGDVERAPVAKERFQGRARHVDYFEGAGNTPEYWFREGREEHRKAAAKAKKARAAASK